MYIDNTYRPCLDLFEFAHLFGRFGILGAIFMKAMDPSDRVYVESAS